MDNNKSLKILAHAEAENLFNKYKGLDKYEFQIISKNFKKRFEYLIKALKE